MGACRYEDVYRTLHCTSSWYCSKIQVPSIISDEARTSTRTCTDTCVYTRVYTRVHHGTPCMVQRVYTMSHKVTQHTTPGTHGNQANKPELARTHASIFFFFLPRHNFWWHSRQRIVENYIPVVPYSW